MWDYTDKVKEHFFNPRNSGVMEAPSGVGDVGAIACGDALRLMIKVEPITEVITDAKFQTFGCGSAIASSSALTELIIGKTIAEAMDLTNQDIADYLGGLPPEKMHCSVMGHEALRAAIANYRGEAWEDDHEEGALVCKCFGVDEGMIERAVRANRLGSIEEVTNYTKAGGSCLTCAEAIEAVIVKTHAAMVAEGAMAQAEALVAGARPLPTKAKKKAPALSLDAVLTPGGLTHSPLQSPVKAAAPRLTNLQRIRLIEEGIEELRPHLQRDGGDCELVDVDADTVFVKLTGACVGCQLSAATISGVQERLIAKLGAPIRVVPASSH